MAKILFVEKRTRIEQLGIMYLSAVLKKNGHQVDLIQTEIEDIDEKMTSYKPDFVCYSICTGEHQWAFEMNRSLRGKYEFKSIFGGPHCTFFPEDASQETDYWIIGEGEGAILDIVEGREKNKVVKKPLMEDINKAPFPDREIFYKYDEFRNNPMKNIVTTRDCPYSCSFCFSEQWREIYKDESCKFYQRRSVDNIIEEIREIREKYPLKKVNFNDDNLIPAGKWADEFLEKYPKEIGLPFVCSISANLVNEEVVKKLKAAGLEMVKFALESANSDVRRDILNKPHVTNDDINRTISLFKKHQIRFRIFNIIGLPIKNALEDALETLEFNQKAQPTESWVSIFQPYPKLRLTKYAVENGFLDKEKVGRSSDNYWTGTQLNLPDKDKINNLQKWWHFIVKHNIPRPVVDILMSLPISEEQSRKLQEIRFEHSRKELYGA